MNLAGKKILLGVSGSIAAYKAVILLRSLQKAGATVRVIMTRGAVDFVAPLTFEALSQHPVSIKNSSNQSWNNHIELSLWADLFVIAPASANLIARMVAGMANDMVTACYLASRAPVCLAPSMDVDMWHHPATKHNVEILKSRSVQIIPVGYGPLASGLTGEGRMAEPEEIIEFITGFRSTPSQTLAGKQVMITAGPTKEAIDPVRYVTNASTGKMGIAIADTLAARGADVQLVLGPVTIKPTHPNVKIHPVTTAAEMYQAAGQYHNQSEISIFCAAVADFRPAEIAREKIKKTGAGLTLKLVKNPDIALELGKKKKGHQIHVGFALESDTGEAQAREKLEAKNFDMIVLNSLQDAGAGFGTDTNKTTFFLKGNKTRKFGLKSKEAVAVDIADAIESLLKKIKKS